MRRHYLGPGDLELYCAQLDVLMARIDAARASGGCPAKPLDRAENQCRSLKRRLLNMERSEDRLHENIRAVLQRAGGSVSQLTGERTFQKIPEPLRIETLDDPPRLVPGSLPSTAGEKSMQKTR
jgi:hypothetical protein